ncbi:MAG TPA: HAD family phosphatase [Candidatus Saccharimonadales bacterium]|nr:HAD family phosphatase [Candidatus Saccharimonadales bacterium]
MKKFAVFDIDGTLIRWQLYHSLADRLAHHGYINEASYETMREARMQWKRRTSDEAFPLYERRVVQAFDSALKSISPQQLDEVVNEVFAEYKDQAYTYSRNLIAKLKNEDYFLLAISGSPVEIVSKVAQYYGFDDWRGSTHFSKDGRFTGAKRVVSYHKDKTLIEMIKKHDLSYAVSIGVGDTRSDIAILEMVASPIAFNPDRYLYEYARMRAWDIVLERKNMVYELKYQDGKYQLAQAG